MDFGQIPSASVAIIQNNTIFWSKGYGEQSSIDTVYPLASVSKTVTATALFKLYEQGLFELDDDVNLYLPFSVRNPMFPNSPITFRMLLYHSSSLNKEAEH